MGCTCVCRALLELGICPVDGVNHRGETALYRACCTFPENSECVKVLLEFGADPLFRDRVGKTPLKMAKKRNYWDCVRVIEEHLAQLQ
jgi:ankyrin repeat protein